MTFKEFSEKIKSHTVLVINTIDGLHVEVYKSNQTETTDKTIKIDESDRHHDYIVDSPCVSVDETSMTYKWYDDGTEYETEVFDCEDWKSLQKAYEKLCTISRTLSQMKEKIDDTNNLLYYEYTEKRWKNKENVQ